jgi:oligopeptidase B
LQTETEHWVDVIPHRSDVLIEDVEIFNNYIVLQERIKGLNKLRVIHQDKDYYIDINEETYTLYISYNPQINTNSFRYVYNSMTTPSSVIEFNMETQEKKVLKEQEIPDGNFDKSNYKSERLWVQARDGEKIAVSLVYHKKIDRSKSNPLLLYGYGSYGITVDPGFSTSRLSLLNRGYIFAIAHVRGSEYLGRKWYEDGKFLKKKNTFFDFIDVAKNLINQNYTSSKQLSAMGGSAGGLLMGAIINYEPKLFNSIVAQVPFVDVLTTMLDESIPLTTG